MHGANLNSFIVNYKKYTYDIQAHPVAWISSLLKEVGRNFAWTDLCILSSMQTNRKLKQHGDVLDELLTTDMQFLK